jgi:outer membrane protein assembly factor BamB
MRLFPATVCRLPLLHLLAALPLAAADWNEWRGPQRNGIAPDSPALLDAWPAEGPKVLWTSEEKVPGRDKSGGFGSVVVADNRVYCGYTPTRQEKLTTRTLKEYALAGIGWSAKKLPPEIAAKVEDARKSDERAARKTPAEISDWAQKWLDANLDADSRKLYGPLALDRLKRDRNAVGLDVLAKLEAVKDKEFPDAAALEKWLDEQGFQGDLRKVIQARFPTEVTTRDNVVLCLDAETGKTVWKKVFPGAEAEFGASSTPCVSGGKVYVAGTDARVYCLDAKTGEPVWQAQVGKGAKNCSLLVEAGVAILPGGPLTGFDAQSGKVLWSDDKVPYTHASPVRWSKDGKTHVIVRAGGKIYCLDAKTGTHLWNVADAGGNGSNGTPAIDGDRLVVCGNGIHVYQLAADKATRLFSAACQTDYDAGATILNQHAYVLGRGGCYCVELATGKLVWQDKALMAGAYLAPVLADGKMFINGAKPNGGYGDGSLFLYQLTPEKGTLLAQAPVKQVLCTTPAIANGRAYCRTESGVACLLLKK